MIYVRLLTALFTDEAFQDYRIFGPGIVDADNLPARMVASGTIEGQRPRIITYANREQGGAHVLVTMPRPTDV